MASSWRLSIKRGPLGTGWLFEKHIVFAILVETPTISNFFHLPPFCCSSSLDPCCYRFKITNRGRRTHQLYWMTEGFPPFRQRNHLPAIGNAKGKNSTQRPEAPSPVFKLHPLRMELNPGKTMDMMLEGFSNTPKVKDCESCIFSVRSLPLVFLRLVP